MQDPQALCKAWIEAELQKHKRLLVYQISAEAAKKFELHHDVVMEIVTQVLREGSVV